MLAAGTDGLEPITDAAELGAAGWDRLTGVEDLFQTPRWLAVQQRVAVTALDFLIRRRRGIPVAGLVTAWADETVPWLLARPDTLLTMAVRDDLPEARRFHDEVAGDPAAALLPALVCGGRHLGRTRVLAAPDAVAADVAALLDEVEHRAEELGAACVCLPHVDVRDADLTRLLASRGYDWHTSAHYSWLPIPPGGFEEYLEGMTQHRRRRVRLERRALAAAGVQVEVGPLTRELVPRLGELDALLLAKYGNPADAAKSATLLAGIAEVMGEDALVSVARQGGRIVGFGLVLRSRARGDEQWFGHRAGFDYAAQGRLPLYYDVLYYSVLEAAARAGGVSVLHAGIGSTEAKLARGCLASEQRSYVLRLPRALAGTASRQASGGSVR